MIEHLDAIEKRYNDISEELTKPEVLSDIKKTTQLSKELRDIEETVSTYKKYKKVLNDIEETKEMIKDPELGEMAKDELTNLENQKTATEKELEILLIPKDPNDSKNVIVEIRGAAVEMKQTFLLEIYFVCTLDMLKNKASSMKYIIQ